MDDVCDVVGNLLMLLGGEARMLLLREFPTDEGAKAWTVPMRKRIERICFIMILIVLISYTVMNRSLLSVAITIVSRNVDAEMAWFWP